MATYFIGDVHGCSAELARLLDKLAPGPEDQVYLTGDLFDRGPDPLGVLDLVKERGLHSILSNHEDFLLRCMQDESIETNHAYIHRCLNQVEDRKAEFRTYLENLPLHLSGKGWLMVHAGIDPYKGLEATERVVLLNIRSWPPEDPSSTTPWYHHYTGPTTVVFGHHAKRVPILHRHNGRLVAVGIDTGCVYGGNLTAFRLEDQSLHQISAARDYRRG